MNAYASPQFTQPPPRRPGALARLLRAVAGTAGAYRATRRGSFLVLVVGTLALMSVFAVVYIAIGRADTGAAAGVRRNAARDNVPDQFAEYVGGVLSDSVFSLARVDDLPPDKTPPAEFADLRMRKTWTIPGIDPNETVTTFTPAGTGTDPALSSTMPTSLALNNQDDEYLQYKDWLNLSALSPSGVPVNLINLRDNFDAPPDQMSTDLRLLDANGNPTGATSFGTTLPSGAFEDLRPWYYWTHQRGLNQPTTKLGGAPDSRDYLPYQYASASGSGMYDSRLFELQQPKFDAANKLQGFTNLIDAPSQYRWFFAAKVIDLSGLVNVSTAGDFYEGPSKDFPAGLTPADVDVRRIFTLEDFTHQVGASQGGWKNPAVKSGSYADFEQPANVKDPANYEKYNDMNGARATGEAAYNALRLLREEGFVPNSKSKLGGSAPFTFAKADDRAASFSTFGGFDSSVVNSGSNYTVGALFSANDLLDLFAYRGWNNPTINSTLERILGDGSFSVLRDNRPFAVERDAMDLDKDGKAEVKGMLAQFANARQYITTVSGARPLRSTIFDPTNPAQKDLADSLSADEVKVSPLEGPSKTFPVYAQGLIPASNIQKTWAGSGSAAEFNKFKTMNYGATSAEVGLQVAANMAVNLDRMLNWDTTPRAFTVLVHENFRKELEQDKVAGNGGVNAKAKEIKNRKHKGSWWVEKTSTTGPLDYGNSDVTLSRLAQGSTSTTAAAFNVFGVGPEPVLSSVATFTLYTDAPETATDIGSGGDADCTQNSSSGSGDEITINGTVAADNPDFILQVVAFQLTNPYDVDINLTPTVAANNQSTGPYDYYIDFGQRQFRVSKVNREDPAAALQPVSIKAGATRVFFATNMSLSQAAARLRNVMREQGNSNYISGWETPEDAQGRLNRLIDLQLAVAPGSLGGGSASDYEPVWIEPFTDALIQPGSAASFTNIKKGLRNPYDDTTFFDLFEAAKNATSNKADEISMKTVRLWRALRSTESAIVTSKGEAPRQPTDALPEQFLENDMLVDRIRDGTNSTFKPALDCRLAQSNLDVSGTEGFNENDPDNDPGDNTGFSLFTYGLIRRPADPQSGSLPVGAVPAYMLEARFANGNFNTLSPDLKKGTGNAFDRDFFQNKGSDAVSGDNLSAGTTMASLINRLAAPFNRPSLLPYAAFVDEPADWSNPKLNAAGLTWRARYEGNRPLLPGRIPQQQMRVGDVLLPLAVGPMQFIFDQTINPGSPTPSDPNYNYTDETWLTTSEILALTTGQDRVLKSTEAPANYFAGLYKGVGPSGAAVIAGTDATYLTDKAQVAVDRFAPFYDKTPLTAPNRPSFDPQAGDYRVGLGIPAALAVLDGFIAPEMAKFGSVSKSIPGVVNVTSAPVPVLRALPMLSPSTESGAWWWSGSGTAELGPTTLTDKCDVAATVAGYRDKVLVRHRADSPRSGPIGQAFNADFRDTANVKPDDPSRFDGRVTSSGVEGVRESPGIRSLGELLMARYADPNGNPPTPPDRASIDDLARYSQVSLNPKPTNHGLGIDSVTYKTSGTNPYAVTDAQGTLGQQIAIANGVFNSATNRSDLFGVWFVVQGYQKSDVNGLDPAEPMVPSIQRRFFMVIDRSEVVKKGQKPRIVLMRELPM